MLSDFSVSSQSLRSINSFSVLCWCNILCSWEPDSLGEMDGALHVRGCEQSARQHAYITTLQTPHLSITFTLSEWRTQGPSLFSFTHISFLCHSSSLSVAFIFPLHMLPDPLSLSSLVSPVVWVGSVAIPLCLRADKASLRAFRCHWLCLVSLCSVFWRSQHLSHSIQQGWMNAF